MIGYLHGVKGRMGENLEGKIKEVMERFGLVNSAETKKRMFWINKVNCLES